MQGLRFANQMPVTSVRSQSAGSTKMEAAGIFEEVAAFIHQFLEKIA